MAFSPDKIKKSFAIHDKLNPKVWTKDKKMNPKVREVLLRIAKNFISTFPEGVTVRDIKMTGSMANYNYSASSDIDLHIVVDYDEFDKNEEHARDYFMLKKYKWNNDNDITLFGHDVEVYVENEGEPHVATGVYSIMNDKWITVPDKKKKHLADPVAIAKKATYFSRLNRLAGVLFKRDEYNKVIELVDVIKDDIKKMRQCGLEEGGEFSVENLAFKVLRRSGVLAALNKVKQASENKLLSLEGNASQIGTNN